MAEITTLESYCNELLRVREFTDYCPNGLQVEAGPREAGRIVTGVTASQALIESARELGADLLLVHHGYFWKGEPAVLTGLKGRRVRTLIESGIHLMAYHLPLDAHPEVGNNRRLGDVLGLPEPHPVSGRPDELIWCSEFHPPLAVGELHRRLREALGREPLHLSGGRDEIRRLGWCSGGAERELARAREFGFDAYITGEAAEPSAHLARELGVEFFAAGHHATERYGVQALGELLATRFGLEHRFVDVPNPV